MGADLDIEFCQEGLRHVAVLHHGQPHRIQAAVAGCRPHLRQVHDRVIWGNFALSTPQQRVLRPIGSRRVPAMYLQHFARTRVGTL